MSRMTKPDEQFLGLLRQSGSNDKNEALNAQHELAIALESPLRQGVLVGDVLDGNDRQSLVLERPADPVGHQVGAKVADVGVAVHGRAAGVHLDHPGL